MKKLLSTTQNTLLKQLQKTFQALLGLIVINLLFFILADEYGKWETFQEIFTQSVPLLIMAIGTTVVLISGGLDLSVGSSLALCTCVVGALLAPGVPVPVAIAVALCVGLLVGLVNGLTVVATGVPPFIVTLGMLMVARGMALMIGENRDMSGFDANFTIIGTNAGVSIAIAAAVVVVVGLLLMMTRFGFYAYAIGGNEDVARLSGVAVKRYKVLYYGLGGLMAALAACVQTARLDSARPDVGEGWELEAIAAAVIGGTSLFGGAGSVFGTVIGVLIIKSLRTGLSYTGVGPYWQYVAIGTVIIFAVWVDRLQRRQTV